MNIATGDIIAVSISLVSVISVFLSMRNQIVTMKREIERNQTVLIGDKGQLNVIDQRTCKDHRDEIYATIRRGEHLMEQTLKKMEEMNKNILTIMVILKMKSIGDDED